MKFRTVEEVVDEFRSIAQQLIQAHYRTAYDDGEVGRVEVLPVSWWNALHSQESGIDQKLKSITLESIPKLRNFTNETLLDVLFYTSPVFSQVSETFTSSSKFKLIFPFQNIIDTVANSLNKKYSMFLKRNRNFKGKVSLAGHSLGSLILFDLLCHQTPHENKPDNLENPENRQVKRKPAQKPLKRTQSKQIDYNVGISGTGQPLMNYPQLTFEPKNFFALGSPIGMFVTIRGIDKLGMDFRLPTCDGFYNIFHPYDPVAYRLEALVNPMLAVVPPFLIPHHKGRKRMHLELKETMNRVSTDIKSKFMSSIRNVTDTVCALNPLLKNTNHKAIEQNSNEEFTKQLNAEKQEERTETPDQTLTDPTLSLGQLNQAKRLDYVLQEAPLEFFNEYLFALTSHVCYWDSADTILFIVKEIYSSTGVEADQEIPQHTLKIERPTSSDALQASTSTEKR